VAVAVTMGECFPTFDALRDVILGEGTADSILNLVERGAEINVVVKGRHILL
jgi:hypothetical protein